MWQTAKLTNTSPAAGKTCFWCSWRPVLCLCGHATVKGQAEQRLPLDNLVDWSSFQAGQSIRCLPVCLSIVSVQDQGHILRHPWRAFIVADVKLELSIPATCQSPAFWSPVYPSWPGNWPTKWKNTTGGTCFMFVLPLGHTYMFCISKYYENWSIEMKNSFCYG